MPIIPVALACGGDDGGHIVIPDAPKMVDAPVICLAADSYPAPPTPGRSTDYAATGSGSSATPHEIVYTARLDNASPTDVLFLDLYAGYGVFTTDIQAGNFTIGGDDTKFSTCGLCVLIAADVTSSAIGDWYMATEGSVALTKVNIADTSGSDGSAHFVGTLSNVKFKHVMKSSNGGPADTIADNCVSALPTAAMDAKMAVGSAVGGDSSARLTSGTLEDIPVRIIHNRRN